MKNRLNMLGVTAMCLSVLLLASCDVQESTLSILPSLERPSRQALTHKEALKKLKDILNTEGPAKDKLSQLSQSARDTALSPSDVDATLTDVIAFAEAFPDQVPDLSEEDLLEMYYKTEGLKDFAVEYNVQPIHELANWVSTYIKREMTGELEMEENTFLSHRDSLIEKASAKWSTIYQNE